MAISRYWNLNSKNANCIQNVTYSIYFKLIGTAREVYTMLRKIGKQLQKGLIPHLGNQINENGILVDVIIIYFDLIIMKQHYNILLVMPNLSGLHNFLATHEFDENIKEVQRIYNIYA